MGAEGHGFFPVDGCVVSGVGIAHYTRRREDYSIAYKSRAFHGAALQRIDGKVTFQIRESNIRGACTQNLGTSIPPSTEITWPVV